MSKNVVVEDRVRVNVWILKSQDNELKKICEMTGQSKTDAIGDALQYWLSSQRQMFQQAVR